LIGRDVIGKRSVQRRNPGVLARESPLRNLCAQHSRFWNQNIGADTPRLAKVITSEFAPQQDRGRVFNRVVAIQALMNVIDPASDWKHKFKAVIADLPLASMNKAGITPAVLGLVPGWEQRPFWQ
jgi:abortive infection bacteriophage resistance protein